MSYNRKQTNNNIDNGFVNKFTSTPNISNKL